MLHSTQRILDRMVGELRAEAGTSGPVSTHIDMPIIMVPAAVKIYVQVPHLACAYVVCVCVYVCVCIEVCMFVCE